MDTIDPRTASTKAVTRDGVEFQVRLDERFAFATRGKHGECIIRTFDVEDGSSFWTVDLHGGYGKTHTGTSRHNRAALVAAMKLVASLNP